MSLFSFDELKFKLHSIQNPALALIKLAVNGEEFKVQETARTLLRERQT